MEDSIEDFIKNLTGKFHERDLKKLCSDAPL